MPTDPILLTPLEKALASLEDVLAQPKTIYIRDATIQRFEYTFELALKMIQRYFQEKNPSPANTDTLTYNDLCRMAAEAELITDPKPWFDYRHARNLTSHAYDEEKAEEVYASMRPFLQDAKHLLAQLKTRI